MAPTGDVLFFTFIILGLLITLVGYQLLVAALLPKAVERSRTALAKRPIISAFAGGFALLLTIGLFAGLKTLGQVGNVIGLGLIVVVSTLAVCGMAAFSRIVGERMPSAIDATSPWRPTLRGAITSEIAFTFPIVGWLLFAVAIVTAGGAGVLGVTGIHALASRLRHGAKNASPAPAPASGTIEPEPLHAQPDAVPSPVAVAPTPLTEEAIA